MPPPERPPADTLILLGNSAAYFNTPHLLSLSNPDGTLQPIRANRDDHSDWKIFIVFAGLTALAFSRYLSGSRINHFFNAAFGSNYFNQMEREGGFFNESVTYLLYFNFLIVFSLLTWQTMLFFGFVPEPGLINPMLLFFLTLLAVSLFSLIKSLVLGFIAWIFKTRTATMAYLKNLFLFNQLTGLAMLPAVVYLAYSPSLNGMIAVWSFWALANVVKLARGVIIGFSHTSFSAYYLILYLCSVELVPLALIIKLGSIHLISA